MYFRSLLVVSLILITSSLKAQILKYEPGFIVTNNDSIPGFIQRTDEITLGEFINYKKELTSSEVKQYYPQDLIGFGFKTDNLKFEKVSTEIRQDSVHQELRFAKIILKGYLKMYKVALPNQKTAISTSNTFYVFVIKKDFNYYTLGKYETEKQVEINNNQTEQVTVNNKFIGVLSYLLNDHDESVRKLINLKFEEDAIIRLIENYNKFKNPEAKNTEYTYKVKPLIKSGIETSFGILVSPVKQRISKSKGFSVGYFWDIQKPDFSRKFSSRLGINYMHLSFQLQEKPVNFYYPDIIKTINRHYLRFPLQGQLNLNNFTNKVCFFLNGGFTPIISSSDTFKSVDIIPFISLGAGAYVNKFKIAIQLDNDGLMVDEDKIIGLSLGYRLK